MVSYAQNFEDVMLRRVFGTREEGFYVDVGAMDPVDGSVTKAFYDVGWNGINIEPDRRFYEKLVAERRRDINLNLALGDVEEIRTLHRFDEQGISTFSTEFRDYFKDQGLTFKETPCKVRTLKDICREFVRQPMDFLKVDAEGWEGPILRGADWAMFRPVVLVIEATLPFSHTPAWSDWEPFLLQECEYHFVYFDGLNRFYLRRESLELEHLFAYPPNVLDGFERYATVVANRQADEALSQLEHCSTLSKRLAEDLRAAQALTREHMAAIEMLEGQLIVQRDQATELRRRLAESRFWIGRLSEMLALTKR